MSFFFAVGGFLTQFTASKEQGFIFSSRLCDSVLKERLDEGVMHFENLEQRNLYILQFLWMTAMMQSIVLLCLLL